MFYSGTARELDGLINNTNTSNSVVIVQPYVLAQRDTGPAAS